MQSTIFYDDRQSVPDLDSYSPSAGKPARFMELMQNYARTAPHLPVTKATLDDLYLVHSKSYVDGVFDGTILNGFECRDARVPEACLWTVGSMVSAALHAPNCVTPVCSPTSGFHHAGHDFGGGFCTFNGLMVSAAKFLIENPGSKVAVLDCDFHYGDGTADIIRKVPLLNDRVIHFTSGKSFFDDADPVDFFRWLSKCITEINQQGCDLTLYQAGADMHREDPLGGFLDDDQMARRDAMVFRGIHGPIVWNLAGGYRGNKDIFKDPVLETHRRTFGEANASAVVRAKSHAHA